MTVKITVSLPDEVAADAKRAVSEGRAPSVSAYVASAIANQREQDTLDELITQMEADGGSPSADAFEWAQAVVGKIPPGQHAHTPRAKTVPAAS